jgi:hypothetical protein
VLAVNLTGFSRHPCAGSCHDRARGWCACFHKQLRWQ